MTVSPRATNLVDWAGLPKLNKTAALELPSLAVGQPAARTPRRSPRAAKGHDGALILEVGLLSTDSCFKAESAHGRHATHQRMFFTSPQSLTHSSRGRYHHNPYLSP